MNNPSMTPRDDAPYEARSEGLGLAAATDRSTAVNLSPLGLELVVSSRDATAIQAALAAGADVVCFDCSAWRGRRRIHEVDPADVAALVQAAREHGAKIRLSLPRDLTERELVPAVRLLKLARDADVDAVLTHDAALLAFQPHFPGLRFHLDAQAGCASSADVSAAGRSGAVRVILSRELTLAEIRDASGVPGLETEVCVADAENGSVFGDGPLPNRPEIYAENDRTGAAAPAAPPWNDMPLCDGLAALVSAGVRAVSIAGRAGSAAWIEHAVRLYRRALAGETSPSLADEARALAAGAGRASRHRCRGPDERGTSGITVDPLNAWMDRSQPEPNISAEADEPSGLPGPDQGTYALDIDVEPSVLVCRCHYLGETICWTMPKTVIHRPHKAVAIGNLLDFLSVQQIQGCDLERGSTNDPGYLMAPRKVNELTIRIGKTLQQRQRLRARSQRREIPAAVQAILAGDERDVSNCLALGQPPDRARLNVDAVESFLAAARPEAVIVEGLTADRVKSLRSLCRHTSLIVALPPIFFEAEIDPLRQLVRACRRAGIVVEVNSWGGWLLAKEAGARIEGGPSLPVLTTLTARVLRDAGLQCVTLPVEADRRQLERLTNRCPMPCSLVVYGRPPSSLTRAAPSADFGPQPLTGPGEKPAILCRERSLWVRRPAEPFDLRNERNDRIHVRHLVVDLVGAAHPVDEWFARPDRAPFLFNYACSSREV